MFDSLQKKQWVIDNVLTELFILHSPLRTLLYFYWVVLNFCFICFFLSPKKIVKKSSTFMFDESRESNARDLKKLDEFFFKKYYTLMFHRNFIVDCFPWPWSPYKDLLFHRKKKIKKSNTKANYLYTNFYLCFLEEVHSPFSFQNSSQFNGTMPNTISTVRQCKM